MNLQNKTLIVTGVASGIGAELARLARFQGATVIGVDRHEPQLTLDGFFQADLGDPASIDALVARLPARVDGLCNIAGVPGTAPVQAVATVNYLGLRHLTQSLLPRMPAGGSIVNVASVLGAHQLRCAGAGVYPDSRRFRQHARAGAGGRRQPAHDPSGPGR